MTDRLEALHHKLDTVLARLPDPAARVTGMAVNTPGPVSEAMVAGARPLRAWREYRGLTQQALALRAGTSKQQISSYERGEKTPNVPTLYRLAAALGTIMDNLVDIDDDMVIEPDPDED